MVGGALPFGDGLVSQAGGCAGTGMGMGGIMPGLAAGATALPFPANAPAPTGIGAGVTGMAGILPGCGANMPGPENGLYAGYDAGAGLPGAPLFNGENMSPLFNGMPCGTGGLTQDACAGLPGRAGSVTFAPARDAFRLRLSSKSMTIPASNAPNRMVTPPTSSALFDEPEVDVPVLFPPLFPEFVPFVVGVWLFPSVGDAPAVGDAPVTVALAVTVGVTVGVVVGEGVIVGEGVGDGWGVGDGDTTGAV